jgi:hypothetical protein
MSERRATPFATLYWHGGKLGCLSLLMLMLAIGYIYWGFSPESIGDRSRSRHELFHDFLLQTTSGGIGWGAILIGLLSVFYLFWSVWRVADNVAATAYVNGVLFHASLLHRFIPWSEVSGVRHEITLRASGIGTQRIDTVIVTFRQPQRAFFGLRQYSSRKLMGIDRNGMKEFVEMAEKLRQYDQVQLPKTASLA